MILQVKIHPIFTAELIFYSVKVKRVAEQCEETWICKGAYPLRTGTCCILQDMKEFGVCKTTTMAPRSSAEQRACAALPLSLNPWCRGADTNPSSMISSWPEGSVWYLGNGSVDLYC